MDGNEERLYWHEDVTRFSEIGSGRFRDASDVFRRTVFDSRICGSERAGWFEDNLAPSFS